MKSRVAGLCVCWSWQQRQRNEGKLDTTIERQLASLVSIYKVIRASTRRRNARIVGDVGPFG
jgi:hypothetical protein